MNDDGFTAASDEDLLDRYLRSGERSALEALLDRYLVRLRGLVTGMVGDEPEADDLTQEIFLRAIRGLPRFRKEASFSTWLYRVAMNTVQEFLRQRDKRPASNPAAVSVEPGRRCHEPERRAINGELNGQIAAAVASLSPRLRAAVLLMAIDGLSGEEAAAIEGCTPSTMYWRVHEARKQLAQQLAAHLPPSFFEPAEKALRREASKPVRGTP